MISFPLVNIPSNLFLESLFRFMYVIVWTLSNVKDHKIFGAVIFLYSRHIIGNKHNADIIMISIFQCLTRLFVVKEDYTFDVKPIIQTEKRRCVLRERGLFTHPSTPFLPQGHCMERIVNKFFGIRHFSHFGLGIWNSKAKTGRDSVLEVCAGGRMAKATLGITGLK